MILQKYPNLEELVYSGEGEVMEVRMNFSEYRARNLPVPQIRCSRVAVDPLFPALVNPSDSLSTCVRRLRVRMDIIGLFVENLDALLHILDVNQRMEYLDIVVADNSPKYAAEFQKHHLKPIDRALNFPLDSKLAFLSVLSSTKIGAAAGQKKRKRRAAQGFSLHGQLDQQLLSDIFAFAAPRVLREVYFHLFRDVLNILRFKIDPFNLQTQTSNAMTDLQSRGV
ncbi:hypothetical protein PR001_g16247 [Phytophthora rubi]|uniref:Uncharacterized protein n=1 Tax=Phytophthora rubi TaxID=129364 RepID=A0A6A3KQ40_9STRA|nr:hypothetical protein PR002_g16615 [Phytophthora rubi]KAE9010168.1 hypothetical protein PR001_g16247 [Phytophthora rubi]